ncbi:glycoside hydrolase family 13 protein [Lacticaseibacillus absianus]|uniref:glycoside hydrolase family 13 protein n=1 Tax=Lacticaseibacillus absianus TaxID=2729623 RepID=UPI0015C6C5A0|nr:alpha-glucosidase [Lacticaseibacillus absianus]
MRQHWWQSAVVYQIYPRSFQDSDGDGIGDLNGIISRLDYLQQLGIGAIWLSPVYRSPSADNGYDIADYQAIDPLFGTMADMDRLILEAGKRGIRLIMDLVVNHTSDEHPWFVAARQDPNAETRDYYIWADPVDGHEPNALTSGFTGGSAWEFDERSGQYFLHLFSRQQIDLNWASPALRQAVYQMMNFWIDRGIAGFRLDVVDMIGKDWCHNGVVNGPHLHEYLHEMNRKTWRDRDFLTVGEAWSADPELARGYSDPQNQELSMIFQFGFTWADRVLGGAKWETQPLDIVALKQALFENQWAMASAGWPSLFWSNHDLPRAVTRYGQNCPVAAKMLAIVLHGLRGTPFIYQGEELGMTSAMSETIETVDDVEARAIYRQLRKRGESAGQAMAKLNVFNRDQARTPMQWDATPKAGFTTGTPWLAINADHTQVNAAAEVGAADSVWATYRQLIALRRHSPILQTGTFGALEGDPEQIIAYTRSLGEERWLIVANFAETPISTTLASPAMHLDRYLISNYALPESEVPTLRLRPYEAFIARLK